MKINKNTFVSNKAPEETNVTGWSPFLQINESLCLDDQKVKMINDRLRKGKSKN